LVHAGEGQLHLGLGAQDMGDAQVISGGRDRVVEQRGLTDPRLAANDQHAAVSPPYFAEFPGENFKFATPTDQNTSAGLVFSPCDVLIQTTLDQ
jgi:hypothetical protein